MAVEPQEAVGVDGQAPPPMKFSRYRSVRKAAKKLQNLDTSVPPVPAATAPASAVASPQALQSAPVSGMNCCPSPSIKKSMSRYRRNRAPTAHSSPASPTQVTHPPLPSSSVDGSLAQAAYGSPPQQEPRRGYQSATEDEMRGGSTRTRKATNSGGSRFYGGNGGDQPPQPKTQSSEEDEFAREKHRRNAMDRLTGGSKRSAPVSRIRERMPRMILDDRVPANGHDKDEDRSSRRSSNNNESKRLSLIEMIKMTRSNSGPKNEEKEPAPPKPVEPSPVVTPFVGMDAPVSAVNAGERRVLVQYKRTSVNLTVTPSTSVQDLLTSAATCLAGEVDPQSFILIESFTQLDLERPLRRYECVRDIMNSWKSDEENSLIIVPPSGFDALSQLDTQGVPSDQPADATFHIYYSQKPKKWDKRYVTLRSDGQITVSKKNTGQDQTNACHLSDFDIYSPTSGFLSNSVKPPKKICYAIKSQQKSSMFLTTENFVHFFCTNDRSIAEEWYRAVQTWRSWYLVTRLGAGKADSPSPAVESDRVSNESKPYQLGSFKPLLSMDSFDTSNSEAEQASFSMDYGKTSRAKELFARKRSTRERAPPPSAFPKSLSINTTDLAPSSGQDSDESPFAPQGLLGDIYTMRRRAMQEKDDEKRANDTPFSPQGLVSGVGSRRQVSGPSSAVPSRTNTMTSAQAPDMSMNAGFVHRSHSQTKPQTLVDLTPKYQEPPQHARKGRGVAVEPGTLLIDAATGPDLAPGSIPIPPSTTWRRPSAPEIPPRSRQRSNTARSVSRQPTSSDINSTPVEPVPSIPTDMPFIPNTLLSRSAKAAPTQQPNGQPVGHGIATGDRNATKPMLDMSPLSPFAEGSLLRNL